ncbi:MAG: hypothetical protein HDT14_13450 [Oscillibacter sp.]|nr:hypothetical protein [Oscillibacter sp.]
MKRFARILALCCLTAALLAGTAYADVGPKPQLTVRVENGPDEPYYLDLLAEGALNGGWEGPSWDVEQAMERGEIDLALLDALCAAVPEGWHACASQGTGGAPIYGGLTGEDGVHTFGYAGVPSVYRVLIVTGSGEVWMSGTCRREVLQAAVTVDWAAKTVKTPPLWVGYTLQFMSTLLPTLLFEGLILLLFRYEWRKNWKVFLAVNLVTQTALSIFLSITSLQNGVGPLFLILFVPAEAMIASVEAGVYRKFLQGHSRRRAVLYGLTANLVSAVIGWDILEPTWNWIVRIS